MSELCHSALIMSTPSALQSMTLFKGIFLHGDLHLHMQAGGQPRMGRHARHGAKHPEHQPSLLQNTKKLPRKSSTSPKLQASSCLYRWKGLGLLGDARRGRRRRPLRCVVCLQIHEVSGLPPCMDGRALAVGWRTRGWKGELTLPVRARRGGASFEEIFLHCRDADARSTLRHFTIWVSLVDAGDCDLGTFDVDLGGLASADGGGPELGGKTVVLDLSGRAKGGALRVSVYYSVIEGEIYGLQEPRADANGHEQSKCRCFPCLPDLSQRRTRPLAVSARRTPSPNSDPGFITIENAMESIYATDDEEEERFITMEKGVVRARSERPPSSSSFDGGGDGNIGADPFFQEVAGELDVDVVEDEFLRMLEEREGKGGVLGGELGNGKRGGDGASVNLGRLSIDLDLESLVRVAEMELGKAARVWRSREVVGGAALEKEEHEELVKRWRGGGGLPSSRPAAGSGFGSPV